MKKLKLALIGCGLLGLFGISATVAEDYFEISKNLEIFNSVYKELNIYYVDETKPGELMKTGIDGMLRSLDPYTVYYPESKIEDARFMQTGEYGGIGAIVEVIDNEVTIVEPYEGYPAQESGLKAGDIIRFVDGETMEGKTQEDVSTFLKGQAGSAIDMKIERPGQEGLMDVSVERAEVKVPEVPFSGMLDDKTGYVKLTSFTKTASRSVKKAIQELQEEGMEQLVFDLRDNGGGLLREAINIVNLWVPKDVEVVNTRGKLEEWNKNYKTLSAPVAENMPLVILINGSSASASEIVSGAIQDLDRGVVLGTQSFGKGLVQQTKDVAYNAKMKLTVAKYYIPSGRCIQKLDYANRKNDGTVDEMDEASLRTFYTEGGRKVYDGRGVAPDVDMEDKNTIHILAGMAEENILFDFATMYAQKNEAPANATDFKLSDEAYQNFSQYVMEQSFAYNTQTEALLEELEAIATEEQYMDFATSEFEALKSVLNPQKERDLQRFKEEIKRALESEIISRYYYQKGRIEQGLANDPWIEEAKAVFDSNYDSIIAPVK